jgi:hypothetical protein
MSKFGDMQKCIERYYEECLQRGMELIDILDEFREDPLPGDLVKCGTPKEIRRHGQLVGTRYLISSRQANAPIPEDDLFAVV